eukprot:TRINITY_DN38426_c1_g1_i1.p2 TRINITY_DN38426_c1_g1~~TRINITY_DN38426_c1_g1_i1.p2  ORF type:complete len:115 (+),score=5.37 TRINITY_DN38426_c1_g1_i1:3-347(+)
MVKKIKNKYNEKKKKKKKKKKKNSLLVAGMQQFLETNLMWLQKISVYVSFIVQFAIELLELVVSIWFCNFYQCELTYFVLSSYSAGSKIEFFESRKSSGQIQPISIIHILYDQY